MDAIATTGREPDGLGRMTASLGSEAAAGEGTGSAFFGKGRIVVARRGSAGHIIHLIAIGKGRPWREAGDGADSRPS
jgi:hypothetical protein